jgi:hypothetical protein
MKCKDILFRLLVAAALTLAAFALSSAAHGQQAYEESAPTSSKPQGHASQSRARSTAQSPASTAASSSGDQTQEELAFSGRIEEEKGTLVLRDPVTKLTYQLDDQPREQGSSC